jgi:probable F420-dependent oxidoreductase
MEIGAFYFPTDYGIDIRELAREMEQRDFGSLYFPEHTHIPSARQTPFPGGGELQRRYAHTHDPFVTCTAAAAVTTRMKVGTGICLVPQHEPLALAKAVASVDHFSDGRFQFGIGGGWNVEEMAHHGVSYKTRFARMREHILAMKALWTEEEASYEGRYVQFESTWSCPKPLQRPHPPILLGGETDYTLRRVAEYCDGWFPRVKPGFDPVEARARLSRHAEDAGRDPASLSMVVFRAPADAQALRDYAAAGVDAALLELPDVPRDEMLGVLDSHAAVMQAARAG